MRRLAPALALTLILVFAGAHMLGYNLIGWAAGAAAGIVSVVIGRELDLEDEPEPAAGPRRPSLEVAERNHRYPARLDPGGGVDVRIRKFRRGELR